MCIAIPMQVMSTGPGHAQCAGRGAARRVCTALLGDVAAGEWLLVFIDSARERIDAGRAAEINATLDLLERALAGAASDPADAAHAAFELPSRSSSGQLRAWSGATAIDSSESRA